MSDALFDLIDAKDAFADSDWFHACRQAQTPYVVVRSGETSADVLWDYVTLPPSCDAKLRGNFPVLESDVRALFARFAIPESHLRIKPTLICFDRLPFDHAKRAAAELHGLISSYLLRAHDAPRLASTQGGSTAAASDGEQDEQAAPNSRRLWVEEKITSLARLEKT